MIICSILITKQLILCGKCKENWYTDKLAEKVDTDLSMLGERAGRISLQNKKSKPY